MDELWLSLSKYFIQIFFPKILQKKSGLISEGRIFEGGCFWGGDVFEGGVFFRSINFLTVEFLLTAFMNQHVKFWRQNFSRPWIPEPGNFPKFFRLLCLISHTISTLDASGWVIIYLAIRDQQIVLFVFTHIQNFQNQKITLVL